MNILGNLIGWGVGLFFLGSLATMAALMGYFVYLTITDKW